MKPVLIGWQPKPWWRALRPLTCILSPAGGGEEFSLSRWRERVRVRVALAPFNCKWLFFLAVALAAGCVTDPFSQLEMTTPQLSSAQLAELQKRAQPPAALGIQVQQQGVLLRFAGVNEYKVPPVVTQPLEKMASADLTAPGGQFRVPVVKATINGQADVRVLLDSGSNRNLLGYSLARRLNVPAIAGLKPMSSFGIGGMVDNYPALVALMQIGGMELRRVFTLISPDTQVLTFRAGLFGDTHLMVFGVSQLRSLSYLTLDYLHGTVTFGAHESYRPDPTLAFSTAAPLRWESDLPYVDVMIDNRWKRPSLIDTGGDYGLVLPRAQASGMHYWQPSRGPVSASHGVGGATLDTRYTVKRVTLGGATFVDVPARTIASGPEMSDRQLMLGNVLLRRYRVTFDFRNNQLWLER